jgi:hypothetical protein
MDVFANSGGDARALGGSGFELHGNAKESMNELALPRITQRAALSPDNISFVRKCQRTIIQKPCVLR